MANKEKIDYLLLDIRELERLVAGMRDAEVYPVSFFGQTFDLTHKILKDLHSLEAAQIEMLRKQMEEHQALIQSIPPSVATPVQTAQEPPVIASAPIQAEAETVVEEPEVKQIVTEEVIKEVPHEETPVEEPVAVQPEPVMPPERPGLFLNDLLEKKNLSDFRKAFSLNDRFRFRRELFGGDDADFTETLKLLADMDSYADACDYLYNDMMWDSSDPNVADFMAIVAANMPQ